MRRLVLTLWKVKEKKKVMSIKLFHLKLNFATLNHFITEALVTFVMSLNILFKKDH